MTHDSPDSLVLANQLLDVLRFEEHETNRRNRTPVGLNESEREVHRAANQFLSDRLPPEKLRPPLAAAYASHFTEPELRQLIAFFSSPVGQKLESLRMELADAIQPLVSAAYKENMADFQTRLVEARFPSDDATSHAQ